MTKTEMAVKEAEEHTAIPTEQQKKTGNYRKGSVRIRGLKITIENPKGSTRSGVDDLGVAWSVTMKNTYGYFNSTEGNDGDQIDVFLGNNLDEGGVYIVDQVRPKTKIFDEHKVMFGFNSIEEAKQAYFDNYEADWKGFGAITEVSMSVFKNWLKSANFRNRAYSKVKSYWNGSKPQVIKGVVANAKLIGEIKLEETLNEMISSLPPEFDTLMVEIRSPGGSVLEGFEIMKYLRELSMDGKTVVTFVTSNADSIASMIMLAGDYRLISDKARVMIHNPMVPLLEYANAEELEVEAKSLRDLEEVMAHLYSQLTGLEEEEARELMSQETFMNANEALGFGFVDEIVEMEARDVVMVSGVNKQNLSIKMNTVNKLKQIISMVSGSDTTMQNYHTESGKTIEVYQKDMAQYRIGDRTNVEVGKFQLADGSKINVENYVINKIEKGVENVEGGNVGPAPEEPVNATDPIDPTQEPAPANVEDPEVELGKELAGEEPANQDPTEPPATEPVVEELVVEEPTDQEPPVTEPAPDGDPMKPYVELVEKVKLQLDALEKKIEELSGIMPAYTEIQQKLSTMETEMKGVKTFEETVTESIDAIAKSTKSSWEPAARKVAQQREMEEPHGTIFQQLKRKRNLK